MSVSAPYYFPSCSLSMVTMGLRCCRNCSLVFKLSRRLFPHPAHVPSTAASPLAMRGPQDPPAQPHGSLRTGLTISQHLPQTKQAGAPCSQDKYCKLDPVLIFNRGPHQPSVPSATPGQPRCPSGKKSQVVQLVFYF